MTQTSSFHPQTLWQMAGINRTPPAWDQAVLLLIDHQNDYLDGALPLVGIEAAVRVNQALLKAARSHGTPVVHIRHLSKPGAPLFDPTGRGAAFIDVLAPVAGEAVVDKTLPNGFAGTGLADLLSGLGRKDLLITGFMTHNCVSSTARAALDHGYGVTVVADATATRDLPAHGGGVLAAADLQKASLTALADRIALVVDSNDLAL